MNTWRRGWFIISVGILGLAAGLLGVGFFGNPDSFPLLAIPITLSGLAVFIASEVQADNSADK